MRVVVFAYDKYEWLTPTFLHFYKKNWPDNPYHTDFMVTGKLAWADHLLRYINSSHDEPILLLLSDYIIKEPVNMVAVREAKNLCNGDIGCVRLGTHDHLEGHLIDTGIEGYKEYPLDKPYAVSLQASIWRKAFLLEFLRKGENIWQTEVDGSKRVIKSGRKVIWADIPIMVYHPCGYMKKGKVVKSVEQWTKENW